MNNSKRIRYLFPIYVDIQEEKIHLVSKESITVDKLPSKVPENNARYHLYRFKYSHEGDLMESVGKY